jgi:hypothetical protein
MTTNIDEQTGRDLEAAAGEYLLGHIADHQMIVHVDLGTHRHLSFAKPGTSIWSFQLITWPGYLAICGDLQTYVFRRLPDMFGFFGSNVGHINAHYWAEKLTGSADPRVFSAQRYREAIRQYYNDYLRDPAAADPDGKLWAQIEREVLADEYGEITDATRAYQALGAFHSGDFGEHKAGDFTFADVFDFDFTEFDWHYLIACHAIVWGIAKYRAALIPTPAPATLHIGDRSLPVMLHGRVVKPVEDTDAL